MILIPDLNNLSELVSEAVAQYWHTRENQNIKQTQSGRIDQGSRSAVTGGAQLDGFIKLFEKIIVDTGMDSKAVHTHRSELELPGFFRPTKEWDLVVIKDNQLIAAIEAKSQVGPSFGNNFNNRTEEAMGSSLDLWTAYRDGAFDNSQPPFLGYFFMLEDCDFSRTPVRLREPHFKVFPEFVNSSYMKRYEIFCRKLVRERKYSAAAFITSRRDAGLYGEYFEPASDLSMSVFVKVLASHLISYVS